MTKYIATFTRHFEIDEADSPEEAKLIGQYILQDAFPDYDDAPYKDYSITSVTQIEEEN